MTLADLLHKLLFPRPTFGVWLPGIGWLRNSENRPYADSNRHVAESVAKRLQNGARVEYIDTALADAKIEQFFLNIEKEASNGR